MNSSQNSKKTLSKERRNDIFEKFGTSYHLYEVVERRPEWKQMLRTADGELLDPGNRERLEALPKDTEVSVSWEETDNMIECTYLERVEVKDPDPDFTSTPKPLVLYSTPDGPIMGVLLETLDDEYVLLDPCVVQYRDRRIQLFPIFNVARTLRLKKSAVKSEQTPDKILVGAYPGFVIQNKMMKYQLKPNVPFIESPEVDNEARDPVTIKAEQSN
jgi:hypothetical protein